MRYFIYADPHWSSYSSIVRSRGERYSTRIDNLIETINWVELEAQKQNCDAIICLGDFFDKSELNSEEITALQEVRWANMRHYMLVGNHEMGRNDLEISSAHLFTLIPNVAVIDVPYMYNEQNNTSIMFLPYVLENNRKPLKEYFDGMEHCENKIIFSVCKKIIFAKIEVEIVFKGRITFFTGIFFLLFFFFSSFFRQIVPQNFHILSLFKFFFQFSFFDFLRNFYFF